MRFLIIRVGALGDFIQTLPAIGTIRRHFPDAIIELLGYPTLMELAHGRYYADNISSFDQAGVSHLFSPDPSLPEALANYLRKFDVILSYVGGADRIFTQNLKRVNAKRVITQNSLPNHCQKVHVVDHLLRAVLELGLKPWSSMPKIYLTEEDRRFAELFLSEHGIHVGDDFVVAIHPGSGGRQKCWPTEKFAEVIRLLSRDASSRILLIEGPADVDSVKKLLPIVSGLKLLRLANLSLVQLTSILEKCHAFIGNDSGITHLAAAVGTKTLAIFGPTDPDVWGPRGENVRIVCRPLFCSPCEPEERRACQGLECLRNVGVEEVMNAFQTFFRVPREMPVSVLPSPACGGEGPL